MVYEESRANVNTVRNLMCQVYIKVQIEGVAVTCLQRSKCRRGGGTVYRLFPKFQSWFLEQARTTEGNDVVHRLLMNEAD